MNVLAGKGKLGYWLDDHVRAARSGISNRHSRRKESKIDKLSTVYGQVLDLAFVDHRAHHGSSRFRHFPDILHFDLG